MADYMSPEEHSFSTATLYDVLGGEGGVHRLVDRFYDVMDREPAAASIRAMHAADLSPVRQRLFEFLSGWLGGPRLYGKCVVGAHRPFSIGADERDQWFMCMQRALSDAEISLPVQKRLEQRLFSMADFMRNR
jgi:hemoglobin